jgi:hypothetical protein
MKSRQASREYELSLSKCYATEKKNSPQFSAESLTGSRREPEGTNVEPFYE